MQTLLRKNNSQSADFLKLQLFVPIEASASWAGAQPALHFGGGGAIFTKFHLMTSSCLFNRATTFSQTVTYNNNVFLSADTKSIVQTHTFCTTLVDKNKQNRTFYNSVGGWITGVKRNFWLHSICACTEQHSTYQIHWENWWLGLRIWCLGKCVGLGFILQLEKEK